MPRPVEHECHFEPVAHAYLDCHGRRWRSVTQTLTETGCVDLSMVDPETLALAAERGRRVHELSAQWDRIRTRMRLTDMFARFKVPESLHGYLYQYERFLIETGFVAIPHETERPRLVQIHGRLVGMTPDRVGHFPGSRRLVVLDLKTGVYMLSHPLQLAGYSLGLESVMRLAMLHERIALYLTPESYRMQPYPHQQDYYAFLDALNDGAEGYLATWKHHRQRKLIA